MAPPRGASDNILVARLNGTLIDPYHGAPVPRLQNYSMDSMENKVKKNRGEKWKGGKAARLINENKKADVASLMVHPDYLNKYGTLSNGVLTKSIKYAEAWLYGTVGVRGAPTQRPSLFLYSRIVPPASRIVDDDISVKGRKTYVATAGPNHSSSELGGCVFPVSIPCSDCGGDIRMGSCSACNRNFNCKSNWKKGGPSMDSPSVRGTGPNPGAHDPYNLMRRHRLGGENVKESPFLALDPSKNASAIVGFASSRSQNREHSNPSFETFRPKQNDHEVNLCKKKKEVVTRRRSILECEVNVYELNKDKSKEGDSESSDDLCDDAFASNSKAKILRAKSTKTDAKKGVLVTAVTPTPSRKEDAHCEHGNKSEVRLNGQRFKIFEPSTPSPSSLRGFVGDHEFASSSSGATSPKRPPRKPKDRALGDAAFKYCKLKSTSSPNLSIKSILKKPTDIDDASYLDLPLEHETSPSLSILPRSEDVQSRRSPSVIKKPIQSTFKKKKQVQFQVSNSFEFGFPTTCSARRPDSDDDEPIDSIEPSKTAPGTHFEKTATVRKEYSHQSNASENFPLLLKTSEDCTDHTETTESGRTESHYPRPLTEKYFGHDSSPVYDGSHGESLLKRSYSDRRPGSSSGVWHDGAIATTKNHLNSHLFNDTMALRTRKCKVEAKEIFGRAKEKEKAAVKGEKGKESKKKREKVNSSNHEADEDPIGSDPKLTGKHEKLTGNLISYAEFSLLSDTINGLRGTRSSKMTTKKPKTEMRSCAPVKRKPQAPSPPPRQVFVDKSRKKSDKICVKMYKKNAKSKSTGSSESNEFRLKESEKEESHRTVSADGRTIVTLSSLDEGVKCFDTGIASIAIHPENGAGMVDDSPQRKASIIISNCHVEDSNKVTISVRNESSDEEMNSSCTIIETGSNATVIPVVSTDNKTTLIVGSSSVGTPSAATERGAPHSFSSSGEDKNFEKPREYIFSSIHPNVAEEIEFLDPVEAVRRNLVPHICGKEVTKLTLMEKIKQARGSTELKNSEQISQLFAGVGLSKEIGTATQPLESLIASYKSRRSASKSDSDYSKLDENSSTAASRSNSFRSTINSSVKNSSTDTSRSSSFRSNSCKSLAGDHECDQLQTPRHNSYVFSDAGDLGDQEKDRQEYEYEIRSEFQDEGKHEPEGMFSVIKDESNREDNEGGGGDATDDPPPLPLASPPPLDQIESRCCTTVKSMFEGASKYDILNYLVDAKYRVQQDSYLSSSSAEDAESTRFSSFGEGDKISLNEMETDNTPKRTSCERGKTHLRSESDSVAEMTPLVQSSAQNFKYSPAPKSENLTPDSSKLERKSSAEIERNDSGVGSETSHTSRSKWQTSSGAREDTRHLCEDCDQIVETQVTEGGVMYVPLVCRKCSKKRSERKEIIQEIVETEEKYGRDLKIILEEFYTPMLVAGLLTPDQLSAIFLNTEELLENSEQLTEKLRDTLEIAVEQGDEDLLTVNIGKLFLEAGSMLHAFETYCTRQGAAAVLLTTLEKEKELLRIFLRVSQMENTVLRRMNLNSFLMVPVQRVTKYPLLLARLYKVTPSQQEGRELLKEAQHNIELHLEHMNSEAKDVGTTKVWRKFSTSTVNGRKSTAESEKVNIKLRKMAVDALDWNHEEVRFVMEGKLLYTQPADNNWKRGRTIKLSSIFVLLITFGKPNSKYKLDPPDDELNFPCKTGIREATLLLVKEKCGRYSLIREPLYLDKIIVCCETDVDEYFEVQELSSKESFIFKAEDGEKTKEWYKHIQYHAQILGAWRKRRNALANIMINGMTTRAYG